jgi:hypothetical protein
MSCIKTAEEPRNYPTLLTKSDPAPLVTRHVLPPDKRRSPLGKSGGSLSTRPASPNGAPAFNPRHGDYMPRGTTLGVRSDRKAFDFPRAGVIR